jgi:hypothetical protein
MTWRRPRSSRCLTLECWPDRGLPLTRAARDDEERLGVRRFRLVASLLVIVFALAFPVGSLLTGWRPWPAVNFVMFVATLAVLYGVWLPKILRRRFEAELREDPPRAARGDHRLDGSGKFSKNPVALAFTCPACGQIRVR